MDRRRTFQTLSKLLVVVVAFLPCSPSPIVASQVPGQTLGSELLQKDTAEMLLGMDRAMDPNCKQRSIVKSEVIQSPSLIKSRGVMTPAGPWRERWYLDRCGKVIAWDVQYTPSRDGGTDIALGVAPEVDTPPPNQTGSKVVLHVFRPWNFLGGAGSPVLYCDDKELAELHNGRFFNVELEPGLHTIHQKKGRDPISLTLSPGGEYFMRFGYVAQQTQYGYAPGVFAGHLVNREAALSEFPKLKPVVAKDILDPRVNARELTNQAAEASATTGATGEMFKAAERGDSARVEGFLAAGSDIEAKDEYGRTPLIVAATNGRLEVVKLLVAKGASVHAKNENGMTPLSGASGRGQAEVVRFLIEQGVDVNEPEEGPTGETVLFRAAASGSVATVDALLRAGSEVNFRSRQGQTALMRAALNGASDNVLQLLEHGADANIKDSEGKLALGYVGKCLSSDAIQKLIKQTTHTVKELDEALVMAVSGPPPECSDTIKSLVQSGAEVNWQGGTPSGDTVLMLAAMWGREQSVRTLLSLQADAALKNNEGKTAADAAATKEIRMLIVEAARKQ